MLVTFVTLVGLTVLLLRCNRQAVSRGVNGESKMSWRCAKGAVCWFDLDRFLMKR
jgi:hypothetical protein